MNPQWTKALSIIVPAVLMATGWAVARQGEGQPSAPNGDGDERQGPVNMFPRGSMQSRFETIHVVVSSAKSFDRLCADFESIVPRAEFDIFGGVTAEQVNQKIQAMPDEEGMMILAQTEIGRRQSLLVGHPVRAKQYLVGNPRIASRIIGRHTAASLYLPLRVLVYEDERGRSAITYDQPSSLIGQFQDEQALDVARLLDGKLCEIASKAVK